MNTIHPETANDNGTSHIQELMAKHGGHGAVEQNAAIDAEGWLYIVQQQRAGIERECKEKGIPLDEGRMAKAEAIVLAGLVSVVDDRLTYVHSQRDIATVYSVNGNCECEDYIQQRVPLGLCKHRIAARLYRRALQATAPVEPAPAPAATTSEHVAPFVEVQAEVYVKIGGHKTKFVVKAGSAEACSAEIERLLAAY